MQNRRPITQNEMGALKYTASSNIANEYQGYDPISKVGFCCLLGREAKGGWGKNQEDRLQYAVLEGFQALSETRQKEVFKNAIEVVNAEIDLYCKDFNKHVGSTLCAAVAWLDQDDNGNQVAKTVCANLGDSLAYLCIVNSENGRSSAQLHPLNTPHVISKENYQNNTEYKRLGGEKYNFHLRGNHYCLTNGLMPTRSLGDYHAYKNHKLSHDPEILLKSFPIAVGDKAFVIVASDGIEGLPGYLIEQAVRIKCENPGIYCSISKILSNNSERTFDASKVMLSESIALDLVQTVVALTNEEGRIDNIAVTAYPVQEQPVSSAVFDGHGGSVRVSVSEFASQKFYKRLQEEINNSNPLTRAAIRGVYHYQRWKDKQLPAESNRGPNTWLTGIRHFSFGVVSSSSDDLLCRLLDDKTEDATTISLLTQFFEDGYYNKHSATQFVLDEVSKVNISTNPWKEIQANSDNIYDRASCSRK